MSKSASTLPARSSLCSRTPASAIIVPSSACETSAYAPVDVTWYWREPSDVESQTSPSSMYAIESAYAAGAASPAAASAAQAASARRVFRIGAPSG